MTQGETIAAEQCVNRLLGQLGPILLKASMAADHRDVGLMRANLLGARAAITGALNCLDMRAEVRS